MYVVANRNRKVYFKLIYDLLLIESVIKSQLVEFIILCLL